jgi:hypothetical protein
VGGVLGVGHVPDLVRAVLDCPVPSDEVGEPGGAGLSEAEAGDRVDGHGAPPAGVQVAGLAGDLQDLGGVREAEVVDGDGFEGAELDAAVAWSRVRSATGTLFQASRAQRSSRVGWLALTVNR